MLSILVWYISWQNQQSRSMESRDIHSVNQRIPFSNFASHTHQMEDQGHQVYWPMIHSLANKL